MVARRRGAASRRLSAIDGVPDRRVADLYGAPRVEFVRRRNALASELRAAGRSDAARSVQRLPKPSVALWAVNQAARAAPDAVRDLIDATETMRRTMTQARAGDGAAERRRRALATLLDAARAALEAAGPGPSPALLRRVSTTLDSAAIDRAAQRTLREARVSAERQAAGFDSLSPLLGLHIVKPAGGRRNPRTPRDAGGRGATLAGGERQDRIAETRRAARDQRRAAGDQRRAAGQQRRAAGEQRRAAREAQRAAREQQRRLEQAQRAARTAEAAATRAERRAAAIRERLSRAEADAARARDRARAAERTARPQSPDARRSAR
jgi:hypothetical protein